MSAPSTASACTLILVRLIAASCSGRSPTAQGRSPEPSTRIGTSTLQFAGRLPISTEPAPPLAKVERPRVFCTFPLITTCAFVSIALRMNEQYSCVRLVSIASSPRACRSSFS